MKKRIVTVVGKDSVGIIAKVCVYFADNEINILDITQTIVGGYFNMMMVVDIEKSSKGTAATSIKSVRKSVFRSRYSMNQYLNQCTESNHYYNI